ncbi:hypothetical protein PUN28_018064 [Cardiocondyla obscurior]|uniref:Ribosomal protein S7 n=1 Tax=Cardiocondyla obscurior TaxID=286306 RepID=A0AAW2EFL7_9HYME
MSRDCRRHSGPDSAPRARPRRRRSPSLLPPSRFLPRESIANPYKNARRQYLILKVYSYSARAQITRRKNPAARIGKRATAVGILLKIRGNYINAFPPRGCREERRGGNYGSGVISGSPVPRPNSKEDECGHLGQTPVSSKFRAVRARFSSGRYAPRVQFPMQLQSRRRRSIYTRVRTVHIKCAVTSHRGGNVREKCSQRREGGRGRVGPLAKRKERARDNNLRYKSTIKASELNEIRLAIRWVSAANAGGPVTLPYPSPNVVGTLKPLSARRFPRIRETSISAALRYIK